MEQELLTLTMEYMRSPPVFTGVHDHLNTTSPSGAGTANPYYGTPAFTPVFSGVHDHLNTTSPSGAGTTNPYYGTPAFTPSF